jgi:hypothetical protein
MSASRLYKRIMRHYCYMQIYEKKKSNMGLFKYSHLNDEDLFIEFKLDLHSMYNKDAKLFDLLTQARRPEDRNREKSRRGKEHETMPYFLTDQYKQVLKESQRQDEENKVD